MFLRKASLNSTEKLQQAINNKVSSFTQLSLNVFLLPRNRKSHTMNSFKIMNTNYDSRFNFEGVGYIRYLKTDKLFFFFFLQNRAYNNNFIIEECYKHKNKLFVKYFYSIKAASASIIVSVLDLNRQHAFIK